MKPARTQNLTAPNEPPRTDATARLLLLLARERLSGEQQARARALASEVSDWVELVRMAYANFSLPYLHHHLSALGSSGPPSDIAIFIRQAAMAGTMQSLKTTHSLVRFHETCVRPAKAGHAYVKGPALAAAFYRQRNLRISRDIDVLIHERAFAEVARNALAAGGRLLVDEHNVVFADNEQDIDFMIRRNDVLSMLDRDGIHFELHRKIEKQTSIFPTAELLATAEPVLIANQIVSGLGVEWLFCYIAYHHSRHFWSRLHWVADLHAIMASERFDQTQTLALAQRIGLRGTVEATLAFAALTDRPEDWDQHLGKTNGGAFLEACLRGLPGDSAFEVQNLDQLFLFDFANPWQIDPGWKASFWAKSAWHRLAPNFSQYQARRRRRPFEFLYVLENAAILANNAYKRLARK